MNKNTPCDESIHSQVDNIIQQIRTGEVSDDARQILSQGITHDDDVRNAETEGYLRGRNEKIETATSVPKEDTATEPAAFPRYHRRSVWDR